MTNIMDAKVGELAKDNFSYIQLFLKYEIDFYCHGKLTLKEALVESPADEDAFNAELKTVTKEPAQDYQVQVEEWPLDLLADYIQKIHHRNAEQTIRALKAMTESYLGSPHENNDIIVPFQGLFTKLMQEMAVHMRKEEFMLFPFIRKMVSNHGKKDATTNRDMEEPIGMFMHEHETQHDLLTKIGKLFQSYKVKVADDDDFNDIVMLMKEMAGDLALHLHLENNILFPETLKMQKEAEAVA